MNTFDFVIGCLFGLIISAVYIYYLKCQIWCLEFKCYNFQSNAQQNYIKVNSLFEYYSSFPKPIFTNYCLKSDGVNMQAWIVDDHDNKIWLNSDLLSVDPSTALNHAIYLMMIKQSQQNQLEDTFEEKNEDEQ